MVSYLKRWLPAMGILWLGLSGGCRQPEQKFILLPHYESFLSDSLLHQKPTLYEYVLVEAPPADRSARVAAMAAFAQQLQPRLQQRSQPYDYVVKYYEVTEETAPYKRSLRDPSTLSHTYLQDNTAAFLGSYSALRCTQNQTRLLVKVTVKDSLNEQGMPVVTQIILSDSCGVTP